MSLDQLSEEKRMMIDSCRRLIREEVIKPRLDMKLDQSQQFPHEPYRKLWEAGMLHLELPPSVGGPGLSCADNVLVIEEIGYGCLGICTTVMAAQLAGLPLLIAQHEALMKKYLGMMVETPKV